MKRKNTILLAVFLIAIPISIFSMLIYSDKSPSLTGFLSFGPTSPPISSADSTGAEEKSKNFGTLVFNPSFKSELPFDFQEDFSYLAEKAKLLKSTCWKEKDVAACVKSMTFAFDSDAMSVSEQCGNPLRRVQEQFAEQLTLCHLSKSDKCQCRVIIPAGPYSTITLKNDGIVIVQDDEGKKYESAIQGNFISANVDYAFSPGEETFWLKDKGALQLTGNPGSIPFCTIKQELYSFCIERKSQVHAYDPADNENKLRNVYYRFALYIPSISS